LKTATQALMLGTRSPRQATGPRFYQVHRGDRHHGSGKVTVLPFVEFCLELEPPCPPP
jgi:hypothetical protein